MPAQWLAFSHSDLNVAELLVHQGKEYSIACFHCQQAAEKALKAFLLHHGQVPPPIHRLVDLLALCCAHDPRLQAFQGQCTTLDQYYIPTRYPYAAPTATATYGQAEAAEALDYARAILGDIEARIFPPPPSPAPTP